MQMYKPDEQARQFCDQLQHRINELRRESIRLRRVLRNVKKALGTGQVR
jgi:hypothetical protein